MVATPAVAQEGIPAAEATEEEQIVVTAGRFFGTVAAPQPPLVTLDEQDIATYGAGSLAELLDALGPRAGSGRGRGGGHPVVLVNGQRVSGFRELRQYPPESIRRVEVLPEEVAQKYGYRPDQRVVNFILKDNFVSREVELEYGGPTDGGYAEAEADLTLLRIDGPNRFNVNLEIDNTSMLTEAERGIVQERQPSVADDPDPARYRSLVDDREKYALETTWTRGLGKEGAGGSLSINGSAEWASNLALRGLNTVVLAAPDGRQAIRALDPSDPLAYRTRTATYAIAATIDKPVGDWRLTATVDASHARTRTLADRRANTDALEELATAGALVIDGPLPSLAGDPGRDRALTKQTGLTSLVTLVGAPLKLPAGDISTTFSLGYAWDGITSSDTRNPGIVTELDRGDLSAGVDLSIPLTSKRRDVLGAIGDVTLSLGGGINHLSDFGTLADWSAGLTWKPVDSLTLQASYIWREAAPTLADLGNPEIVLLNEPVFDFLTGETALVSITRGGNPLLRAETQRDLKFSASWELPFLRETSLIAEYFRNRSDDVTAAFPLLTPEIEAAFADRVTRDAGGRLIALDRRPVTFARQSADRLRHGIEFSGRLGKAPAEGAGQGRGDAPDPRMMMRGGRQGRWNLSLYHTVELKNRVLVAPGGPLLDLLDGAALTEGAIARHKLEVQGGFFHSGIGGRFSAEYQGPSRVEASGAPGASGLRFGSLAKIGLRLFMDLGQQKWLTDDPEGWLRNMRVMVRIDNLFDERRRVTDENGNVPLRYQPGLVDPTGRMVKVELRKIF